MIVNDLLLIPLNLSVAFDTVNHKLLIEVLRYRILILRIRF